MLSQDFCALYVGAGGLDGALFRFLTRLSSFQLRESNFFPLICEVQQSAKTNIARRRLEFV